MDLGGGPRMLLSKTDIDVRVFNAPISAGNAPCEKNDWKKVDSWGFLFKTKETK
jgi:hypothetical protein